MCSHVVYQFNGVQEYAHIQYIVAQSYKGNSQEDMYCLYQFKGILPQENQGIKNEFANVGNKFGEEE